MNKILGFILLGLGLLIILYGLWSSYNIFSGHKEAPQLFNIFQGTEESSGSSEEQQMQAILEEQLGKILPKESIPQIFNLISWSIFMGILVFGGGKISDIGVRLLRENKT